MRLSGSEAALNREITSYMMSQSASQRRCTMRGTGDATRRGPWLLVVLVALAFGAAACGGDEAEEAAPPPAEPAPAEPAEPPAEPAEPPAEPAEPPAEPAEPAPAV
jgi:hypothetical protein